MTEGLPKQSPLVWARIAGVLYLIIIVLGLYGEIGVRSSLILPGDATATTQHIMAAEGLFRIGFLTDSIMGLSDVALAVLLFALLKPVNPLLALMALCFRLTQTAAIALNLLNYYTTVLLLKGLSYTTAFEPTQLHSLSLLFLDRHSYGYDLGLILFGVHCLILGYLITQALYLPKVLGYLMMAAGITYLVGSYTRFLFPEFVETVAPIYVVAIIAEVSLGLWLLIKGINLEQWQEKTGQMELY